MRWRNETRNVFDVAEDLLEPGSSDLVSGVVIGVVLATCLAIYGLTCVIAQQATFFGSHPIAVVKYEDTLAICLGFAYLFVAVFIHAHFTWSGSEQYHGFAQIGKLISAAGLAVSIGTFVVYLLLYT